MLSEKLMKLMAALHISNSELSDATGLDPTVVSRLKNGRRSAAPDGPQMRKLADGISKLAQSSGNTETLRTLCAGDPSLPVPVTLKAWLCDGMDSHSVRKVHTTKASRLEFGRRLTGVMELLDISNISLAKRLNLDASLISRYKSGHRSPPEGGVITAQLCRYIVWKAETQQKSDALWRLLDITTDLKQVELYDVVLTWLTVSIDHDADYLAVSRLLERIENLSASVRTDISQDSQLVSENVLLDKRDYYYEKKGLQEAALRFLAQAAENKGSGKLLLYSDRSMEWMTDSPTFRKQWGTLMQAVLTCGTRIKIIHNIGRSNTEMQAAISMWLPMYATGLVEPYYCRVELGNRFQHTMFISDTAAVIGSAVRGSSNVFYQYIQEPSLLNCLKEQYSSLLKKSAPVVRAFTVASHKDYLTETLRFFEGHASVSNFAPVPSVLTMPGELLQSILARHNISGSDMDIILRDHTELRTGFLSCLKRLSYTEVTPVLSATDQTTTALYIGLYQINRQVHYTQDEYLKHLSAILDLMRAEPNYHFLPLGASPFKNLAILQKASSSTLVTKTDEPSIAFEMCPPPMTAAFKSFLESLEDNALTGSRNSTINLLEKTIGQQVGQDQ